jgi:tetratricopeptide (TPR) repeat protein
MQANQDKEAETYFNRALQIDPNYANAYMNLAALKLKGDEQVVKEMNNLGTSEKDNKRYDVLKKQRVAAFTAALPYLEKANALDPKNEAVYNNLLSVYNFLEMSDKAKALKARKP